MWNIKVFFKCFVLLLILAFSEIKAQCTGCTTTATNNAVTSYTVVSGQTLCINSSLNYTGTITLNGGVVCNSGTISNVSYLRGVIRNYGRLNGGSVNAGLTGTVTLENFNGSSFNMTALTFSASNAAHIFQLNVYKGASASFNGAVTHNSGNFRIEVGKDNPGANPVNTSTFSVLGLFTTKTAFSFSVAQNAIATFSNITSLEGTGVKTLTNYGTIDFKNNLNMISAGSSASTVTIDNYGILYVREFLNANYTAGTVRINNYDVSGNLFTAYKTVTLSRAGNTLTNNGTFIVPDRLNIILGAIVNTGTMVCDNFLADGGTITNSKLIKVNVDFLLRNSAARLNNNNSVEVINTFSNNAVVTFSANTFLYTKNYYNTGTSSAINGPTISITNEQYPRLYISDFSRNSRTINKVMVYDATLTSTTSNIGYGFDEVSTPTAIASSVLFGSRGVSPGNGNSAAITCSIMPYFFRLSPFSTPNSSLLYGNSTSLDYNFVRPILLNTGITLSTTPISVTGSTWQPGNSPISPTIITPTANQIYTNSISYLGCPISTTLDITLNLNTKAQIDHVIPNGTDVSGDIILTPGGGIAPYTYTWLPSNVNTKDLLNASMGSYTVQIRDNAGTTITRTYNIGYKNKWRQRAYMAPSIQNDVIAEEGETVSQGLARPNLSNWSEVVWNNTASNFFMGFSDSLSKNSGRTNDVDFGYSIQGNILRGYMNGIATGYTTTINAGNTILLRKSEANEFGIFLNGVQVYTASASANKLYALKLLNYGGAIGYFGTNWTDTTYADLPNFIRTNALVKHSSGLGMSDGSITLSNRDVEATNSYTFLATESATNVIENLGAAEYNFIASNANVVSSNDKVKLNFEVNLTTIQNGTFANDELVSTSNDLFALAANSEKLTANYNGEISYIVEENPFSSVLGFIRDDRPLNNEMDPDYGVYLYATSNDAIKLLYLINNSGLFRFLAKTYKGDEIALRRIDGVFMVHLNGEQLNFETDQEVNFTRNAFVAVSPNGKIANVGIVFPNCFHPSMLVTANAGQDKMISTFPSGVINIGGSPTASGGTPPYTYVWSISPSSGITTTPPAYNTLSNFQVNSITTNFAPTVYNLAVTVTDSKGCSGSDNVLIYTKRDSYAVLKLELDGGYHDLTPLMNPNLGGVLNFMFEEDYVNNGVNLDYKIYRMNRTLVTSIPSQSVQYKENRYSIALGSIGLTASNSFYVLEVINKKGEKRYLRFKY